MNIKGITIGVLVGVLTSSGTFWVMNEKMNLSDKSSKNTSTKSIPVKYVNLPDVDPESSVNFESAASNTIDAVVHVKVEATQNEVYYDPFREFFYGEGKRVVPKKSKGAGSGVIISEDGYIVTNNHVIDHADKIEVTLNNNETYLAKIIGTDPSTDLALIKVEGTGFNYIPYANSDDVRVGQWVLAVGNPFNLTSTVTAGIVSAKARSINILKGDPNKNIFPIESFIQTDAAVNPGNSGGALINSQGELIGINTAIASTTGAYAGYAFAVPANLVKKVTKDLMEYGTVQRAFIGVGIQNIDEQLKDDEELENTEGVYINHISEDGAAEEAGLKKGDVILAVGTKRVNSVPELQEQVSRFKPGDKVTLLVKRDGDELKKELTLRNRKGNTELVKKESSELMVALGAELGTPNTKEKKVLEIKNGVKIKSLSSGKLRSAGVKEGFIITHVDKQLIRSPKEFMEIMNKKSNGGVLIEGVYPNGKKAYYAIGM